MAKKGPRPRPIVELFERHFVPEPNSGCWIWIGARLPDGYGTFGSYRNVTRAGRAARVAWMLYRGEIPSGLEVRHKCDTPPCVNPGHLLLGTRVENERDKVDRGRRGPGEKSTCVKLTDAQVLDIRARYSAGNTSLSKLAREYRVSLDNIHRIIRRETWSHLPGGDSECLTGLERSMRAANTRLTPDTVVAIRAAHAAGGVTAAALARTYGLSDRYVGTIVRREVWRHLPQPEPVAN